MASTKNFYTRIQHKHDTEANWLKATNFAPLAGEIIVYDKDSNYNYLRVKIGNGTDNVNDLPFITENISIDAISNNDGIGLDVLIDEIVYHGDNSEIGGDLPTISLDDLMPKAGGTFTGDVVYTNLSGGNITSNGNITANKVYGAVWNDYAEYRETKENIEPGRVICENGDDTLSLSAKRLQPGSKIVSDTFGFAIGKTEKSQTPIAISGRVLAYPYEDRKKYKPGDAVCSGPNGTISKMSHLEIILFPERIIGTVSSIPSYETWGEDNIKINNRIWINVR